MTTAGLASTFTNRLYENIARGAGTMWCVPGLGTRVAHSGNCATLGMEEGLCRRYAPIASRRDCRPTWLKPVPGDHAHSLKPSLVLGGLQMAAVVPVERARQPTQRSS